jgi:site-specific recombinase XerD
MTNGLHEGEQLAHLNTFLGRSFSEGTRRVYRQAVREFFQFIGNCRMSEVTSHHLNTWRDSLLDRNKPSTVRRKLIIIWSLFEYLAAARIVDKNPADKKSVRLPPGSEGVAGRALTPEEVASSNDFVSALVCP